MLFWFISCVFAAKRTLLSEFFQKYCAMRKDSLLHIKTKGVLFRPSLSAKSWDTIEYSQSCVMQAPKGKP